MWEFNQNMTRAQQTGSTDGRSRGARGRLPRARAAALRHLVALIVANEYEEAESAARTLAARRRRLWDRGPEQEALFRLAGLAAAVLHGRGEEVLPELDSLAAEFKRSNSVGRPVLLLLRITRTAALLGEERYTEVESEASGILREVTRLAHMVPVADAEFFALTYLTRALCGQGRFEEAETIARGNLSCATGDSADRWRVLLMRSLNGQHRYEEALAESIQPAVPLPLVGLGRREGGKAERGLVTATALHGLGRHREAEVMTRQTLDQKAQLHHPRHPGIRELRELLARITAASPPHEEPDQDGEAPPDQ